MEIGLFYPRGPWRAHLNLANALGARAFVSSLDPSYGQPVQPPAVAATIDWFFRISRPPAD